MIGLRRLASFAGHGVPGDAATQAGGHHAAPSLWHILFGPSSVDERNQRAVLVDGIGIGLAGGIGTYLSVFLVRLGASSFLVGLLTAMPALTGMLLAMPVGGFLARQRQIVPWFSKARVFVLSCYFLTGLVPFFISGYEPQVIILIWAIATLPQTVVSVAFTVVMGGVAGERGRFTLMSRRWSMLGVTNALTVLLAGQVLGLFDFPLGYQVIFIGSAVGGLISYTFSSSIKLPPTDPPAQSEPLVRLLRQHGGALKNNRRFVTFVASQALFRWGMALPAPLFPIYWVRSLQASDLAISHINSAATAVTLIAYTVWARASQRRSVRWVLLVTSFAVSLYPLLTAFTGQVELLILWAAMASFFSCGVDLVFFDIVLGTCPPGDQPVYIAMYQTTIYISTFLAPLLGTTLADTVGIVPALIAGTVFRFAGFAAMALLGVGRAAPDLAEVPAAGCQEGVGDAS